MSRIASLRVLASSLALMASLPAAAAVHVSASGQGQVLLFPYYTVNAGNDTLLSLFNSTGEVKAVKVHFREALNGRIGLDFNLYLAPYADWRGVLTSDGEDAAPRLFTPDADCTVPAIPSGGVTLRSVDFTGSRDDDGPNTPDRLREGFIEVFDMGVVVDDGDLDGPRFPRPDNPGNRSGVDPVVEGQPRKFAFYAQTVDGVPRDCGRLRAAWAGGIWDYAPHTDIDEPIGGLTGSISIVNVAEGLRGGRSTAAHSP